MADEKPKTGETQPVVVEGKPLVSGTPRLLKAFRVRAGAVTHANQLRVDHEVVKDGDIVLLSEAAAKAFADKYEPVDGSPFKPMTEVEVAAFKADQKAKKEAK